MGLPPLHHQEGLTLSEITELSRILKEALGWHKARIRLHLMPFFEEMGLSTMTAGQVQEYRIHRLQTQSTGKAPSRSTMHDEIVTLRQVLKTAMRHNWLAHLPDLSPPYKTNSKISHRAWFSPQEYKQLYTATRKRAQNPFHERHRWNAE